MIRLIRSNRLVVVSSPSDRDVLISKIWKRCAHPSGRYNLLSDGEKTGFVLRDHERQLFDPAHEWELLTAAEKEILDRLVTEGFMICTYQTPGQYTYNPLF